MVLFFCGGGGGGGGGGGVRFKSVLHQSTTAFCVHERPQRVNRSDKYLQGVPAVNTSCLQQVPSRYARELCIFCLSVVSFAMQKPTFASM